MQGKKLIKLVVARGGNLAVAPPYQYRFPVNSAADNISSALF